MLSCSSIRITKKDVILWEVVQENLEFVGGLSCRLFFASMVIAVGKRAISMSETLFEIEIPCSPSSLRNL
jgi:hypothetical protein